MLFGSALLPITVTNDVNIGYFKVSTFQNIPSCGIRNSAYHTDTTLVLENDWESQKYLNTTQHTFHTFSP